MLKQVGERGFTLIDLLVTVSIMAILTTVALPNMINVNASFNRFNARTYLLQDLKRAQAKALTEGCRGIFELAPDGRSYSFGCDYLAYDLNPDPSPDSIAFTRTLPDDITISAPTQIILNSRGQSVDVDDIIQAVTISLFDTDQGTVTGFSTGTLLGTGTFEFQS